MTHHVIKILEDGTRVYSNYTRYKPKTLAERKYGVRKPDDPRAVMFNKEWFLPLDLVPDELRPMPVTRPDTDAYDHMPKPRKCKCDVCRRPEALRWKVKWLGERGLRSEARRLKTPRR